MKLWLRRKANSVDDFGCVERPVRSDEEIEAESIRQAEFREKRRQEMLDELPLYDPDSPCPKCGDKAYTKWKRDMLNDVVTTREEIERYARDVLCECFERRCVNCSYVWYERVPENVEATA